MLHRRAGACGGSGSARVPPQDDGEASEASRRAQCGGREGRLGQAGAAGRLPRHLPAHGLRQLCRGGRRGLGRPATRSRCTASWRRPIPDTPSIRRRSSGRSPARSSTACRRCSTAASRSRTARSSRTNFDTYGSIRMAEMPKVESVIMPTRRLLGRRRRADDLRGGAGRAQRDLRGDRQAHPLVPAEEPQSRKSPECVTEAAAAKAAASSFQGKADESCFPRLAFAALISCSASALAADPPPGASSCSGCHADQPAAETPVPKLNGRSADEIVDRDGGVPRRQQAGDGHGPHRQGLHRRRVKPIAAWLAAQK